MPAQTVYLIRHGQVDSNVLDLQQRTTIADFNHLVVNEVPDEPINAKGVDQSKALVPKIANLNLRCLYVSSLLRAQQTAQILAETTGIPIITRDDLHEIIRAPLQGPASRELSMRQAMLRSGLRQIIPWLREVEPLWRTYLRARRAWYEMTTQTDGDFGIVGHQGFFRALLVSLYLSWQWRVVKRNTHNAGITVVSCRTSKKE